MPRVVVTQYTYVKTNEEALQIALRVRGLGKRSEIITDEEYNKKFAGNTQMQDLRVWAQQVGIDFQASSIF